MSDQPYSMCPILRERCGDVPKSGAPRYGGFDLRVSLAAATDRALVKWRQRQFDDASAETVVDINAALAMMQAKR